jgi:tetratricopeptide (TPR) repeat protein
MRAMITLTLLLAPALCSAQLADESEGGSEPEPCVSSDATTAEINSREGVRLAKLSQFAEAVPLFRMAVKLDACSANNQLLLARALARSGQLDEATREYRLTTERFPETMAGKRAQKELDELLVNGVSGQLGEEPLDDPAGRDRGTWPLIGGLTAGAGALVALGGLYFALDAHGADGDLQSAARRPDRAAYDDLVARRDRSSTLAYVFYGIGGTALAAGATLAIFGDLLFGGSAQATVAPLPEGGGALTIGGRF